MDKKVLFSIIESEKELYLNGNDSYKRSFHKRYTIWKYLYFFRITQYYTDKRKISANKIDKYLFRYYNRRRNIWSSKSGVEIGLQSKIGINCDIWHSSVVINGSVGDNCLFHGNNIIGEKNGETPRIGNNVEIGAGAVIIGGVHIADGCKIGANAVVINSVEKENSVLVGIPARAI